MVSFEGLSWGEQRVLAALNKAPLGVGTVRAVAQRAGVSTSTAHRALRRLVDTGFVTAPIETVARGRAKRLTVFYFNSDRPGWVEISRKACSVTLPTLGEEVTQPAGSVPTRLRHLFWNTAQSQLDDVEGSSAYIAKRLLSTHSFEGLAWGATYLPPEAWERAAEGREFDAQDRSLALNLAKDAHRRMRRRDT